jgi:hypothetical protein
VAQKATRGWKKERAGCQEILVRIIFRFRGEFVWQAPLGAKCDFHQIDKRRLQLSEFGERDD